MGLQFSQSIMDSGYIKWLDSQFDDDEINSSCLKYDTYSNQTKYTMWNDNKMCSNCKTAIKFNDFYVSCCGQRYCGFCYRSCFMNGHKCTEPK